MNPQTANILRLILAMLGAWLVARGYLAEGADEQLVEYSATLIGSAISLASLFSTIRSTRRSAALVTRALALPKYSTPFDLKEAGVSGLSGGFKEYLIRQALATVIQLVADDVRRSKFEKYLIPLRDELNAAFPIEWRK